MPTAGLKAALWLLRTKVETHGLWVVEQGAEEWSIHGVGE